MIEEILANFGIVHANALYSILYFLMNNMFFFVVIIAMAYLIKLDIEYGNEDFVQDERSII